MIEYVVLAAAAGIFLVVLAGVALAAVVRFKGGKSPLSHPPRSSLRLEDLVDDFAERSARRKRLAKLEEKLSGLVGDDPKSP